MRRARRNVGRRAHRSARSSRHDSYFAVAKDLSRTWTLKSRAWILSAELLGPRSTWTCTRLATSVPNLSAKHVAPFVVAVIDNSCPGLPLTSATQVTWLQLRSPPLRSTTVLATAAAHGELPFGHLKELLNGPPVESVAPYRAPSRTA